MPTRSITISIDIVDGPVVFAESDEGQRFQVDVGQFARKPREGMIYRVPIDSANRPKWRDAVEDHEEMERRVAARKQRMADLTKRDPGGDVKL